ncbi:exosome complex component RRP45-like [Styela clava]
MREIPLSNCEYEFVTKCIGESTRMDGRTFADYREIKITFKMDFGCCIVSLGKTKVLAQVRAEMDRPKESRSSEGNLGIFVEMSTMGSPSFDPTKPGELGIELQRMLERSIILSKAVDLESLCVRVGEQAWNVSLHVQILSHDGNILDCASIASLAALAHFKRPDVSVIGKEVTVHTFEEKHPVPLTFNHQPFCVTFAFFDNGTTSIIDPTKLEENCCDGKLMIAMNKHKEVCCTQMSGVVQVSSDQVLKCTNISSVKVKELSEFVKKAIANDEAAKKNGLKSSQTKLSNRSTKTKPDLDPKTHIASVESKVHLPVIQQNEDEIQGPLNKNETRQKLSWVMNNGGNTFTAGEDGIENTATVAMETESKQTDIKMESDEEEDTVMLQLT